MTRNQRRQPKPTPMRPGVRHAARVGLRLLAGMALAGVLVLAAGLLARVDLSHQLQLDRVVLQGDLRQFDAEQVDRVLAGRARGFFALDLDAVHRDLIALPWVASVQLRRRWPDTLEVHITEPVPVARWGQDRLVDRHGAIFGPVDLAAWDFLPALQGGYGRQVQLMERYLEVAARLADAGLGVSGLREGTRRAWSIQLEAGGEILMGRDPDLTRLDQLVALMPLLREQYPQTLARVDLRYPRGLAVAWQTASAAEANEAWN